MNIEEYRHFCLSLEGAWEDTPFGDTHLVLKVGTKMFALFGIVDFSRINLKCDPERAIELREQYDFVLPGWHMNKKHWNSVMDPQIINDSLLKEMTIHSYQLVKGKK